MFAYCINNPCNSVDPAGTDAEALSWWAATMWWLFAVDGPIPVGDIVYAVGCGVCAVIALVAADAVTDYVADGIVDSKTKTAGGSQSKTVPSTSTPAQPPNNNRNDREDKQRNGTPRNNHAQNRQVNQIAKKLGLSKYQRSMLHQEISGENLSYQEILELAYEIKGMYLK